MGQSFTWFLPRVQRIGVETEAGPVYRLDEDYAPIRAWVVAKNEPKTRTGNVQIDILVEDELGTRRSLFESGVYLTIAYPQDGATEIRFGASALMRAGYRLSVDVVSIDTSVGDLTIGLDVE